MRESIRCGAAVACVMSLLAAALAGSALAQDRPADPAPATDAWALDRLERRALCVDYEVAALRLWPFECSTARADDLRDRLEQAFDANLAAEPLGADSKDLGTIDDELRAWIDAGVGLDASRGRRHRRRAPRFSLQIWTIALRGDRRSVVYGEPGSRQYSVTLFTPQGSGWLTRAGDGELASFSASVDVHEGNVFGWPWQLLGATDADGAASLRDVLAAYAAGDHERSESAAGEGVRRSRYLPDTATAPIPRLALHLTTHTLPEDRVRIEVLAFATSGVRDGGDPSEVLRLPLSEKAEISFVDTAGLGAQGFGSDPTRWPAEWFDCFEPAATWAGLAAAVRSSGRTPGDDVEDIRRALGPGELPRQGSLLGLAAAAAIGAGIIALTFRRTRRPRPRLLATAISALAVLTAFGLSLRVTTPDRVWCLDREPQYGATPIVCLAPDGGGLAGDWRFDTSGMGNRDVLRLEKPRDRPTRDLERELGADNTEYAVSGAVRTSPHGSWREFVLRR